MEGAERTDGTDGNDVIITPNPFSSPGTKLFLTDLTADTMTITEEKGWDFYLTKAAIRFPFNPFQFLLILTQNCTW